MISSNGILKIIYLFIYLFIYLTNMCWSAQGMSVCIFLLSLCEFRVLLLKKDNNVPFLINPRWLLLIMKAQKITPHTIYPTTYDQKKKNFTNHLLAYLSEAQSISPTTYKLFSNHNFIHIGTLFTQSIGHTKISKN
jgi:hypothetical protein